MIYHIITVLSGVHMIHAIISSEDLEIIRKERYRCRDPIVARRLQILFFKAKNLQHQQICSLADVSPPALVEILKKYTHEGLQAIMHVNWKPRRAALDDFRESIANHFKAHPPASVKEAQAEIEKLTGVKRGQTQIRMFLHKIGMSPRKIAGIPAKADPIKQEEFKKKRWSLS